MRWKTATGVMLAMALLIPAAPVAAQTGSPRLETAPCQTITVYTDIRALVTIDLDTASDGEVRVLAFRILAAADANSLATLSRRIQERLAGTPADLRTFLRANLQAAWSVDLRIAVYRTLTGAGSHVQAAAQETLNNGTIDAYLTYLNHGLYIARALDCAL